MLFLLPSGVWNPGECEEMRGRCLSWKGRDRLAWGTGLLCDLQRLSLPGLGQASSGLVLTWDVAERLGQLAVGMREFSIFHMVNVCAENQGVSATQEPLLGSTLKSGSTCPECVSVDMYKDLYTSAGVAGRCLCLWHGVPDMGLQVCVCTGHSISALLSVGWHTCVYLCPLAPVCVLHVPVCICWHLVFRLHLCVGKHSCL